MTCAFLCYRCGGEIPLGWLKEGQVTACPTCRAENVVPAMLEHGDAVPTGSPTGEPPPPWENPPDDRKEDGGVSHGIEFYLLAMFFVIGIAVGIVSLTETQSAIHEIRSFLAFTLSAIALAGLAVVRAVSGLRNDLGRQTLLLTEASKERNR